MKIGVYNIINDPLAKLNLEREIDIEKEDLEEIDNIVEVLNKQLLFNKLSSEHIYAVGMTYGLIPKGIIHVSSGTCEGVEVDLRGLATGLLLMGAEQFICFHNHPGGNDKVSEEDIELTDTYTRLGKLIGIYCLDHIMVEQNNWHYCAEIVRIFGKDVRLWMEE